MTRKGIKRLWLSIRTPIISSMAVAVWYRTRADKGRVIKVCISLDKPPDRVKIMHMAE